MTVHPLRHLAKTILKANRPGTPIRHSRGVIVSSLAGQSVVHVDGGTTDVTVFNYNHTASLPAGTVVDVLFVGNVGHIIGHY